MPSARAYAASFPDGSMHPYNKSIILYFSLILYIDKYRNIGKYELGIHKIMYR